MIVDVVRALIISSAEGKRTVRIDFNEDNDIPVIERVVKLAKRVSKSINPNYDFDESLKKACQSEYSIDKMDLSDIFHYVAHCEDIIDKLLEKEDGFDAVILTCATMYVLEKLLDFDWIVATEKVVIL